MGLTYCARSCQFFFRISVDPYDFYVFQYTHTQEWETVRNKFFIGSCFGIRLREDRVLAQWRAACGCPISDEVRCPVRRMTAAAFEIFQIFPLLHASSCKLREYL